MKWEEVKKIYPDQYVFVKSLKQKTASRVIGLDEDPILFYIEQAKKMELPHTNPVSSKDIGSALYGDNNENTN